jgi:hypothetical protein
MDIVMKEPPEGKIGKQTAAILAPSRISHTEGVLSAGLHRLG